MSSMSSMYKNKPVLYIDPEYDSKIRRKVTLPLTKTKYVAMG